MTNNAISADVQTRRFALLWRAGYGEHWTYFMTKQLFATATLVSLFAINLPACAADLETSCKTLLNQALPVWTMASVSADVKAFAAAELQADPLKIRGDFDGDGRQDIALLIQNRAQPVFEEPDRIKATRIAVCLAKVPAMVLRLIAEPYCDDFIYLVRKGDAMYDIEAGDLGKYPVDAIGTTCFEKAGAVFFFDGKDFRRIVNGD